MQCYKLEKCKLKTTGHNGSTGPAVINANFEDTNSTNKDVSNKERRVGIGAPAECIR